MIDDRDTVGAHYFFRYLIESWIGGRELERGLLVQPMFGLLKNR